MSQADKPKSVLDDVPQICGGCGNSKRDHDAIGLPFPCGMPSKGVGQEKKKQKKDQVVGACPHCGSPIYGQVFVNADEHPQVKRTCNCWQRPGLPTNVLPTNVNEKLGTTKEG